MAQLVIVPVVLYLPASQPDLTVGELLSALGHLLPPGQSEQLALVPAPSAAQRPLLHGEHAVCELSYFPGGQAVHVVLAPFTM